jgi:excinuclease ABC subunit A
VKWRGALQLKNIRENNLRDLSVEIPHDELVVVTGISGSGKSSLAFDTVYAEGQRRYIETFSPYTRQFFDKVKKPDLDSAVNVRPAIAIQQRTRVLNSRSTVGSLTDINDYLKIIWSNLAVPTCEVCGTPYERWSAEKLSDLLLRLVSLESASHFLICAEVRSLTREQLHAELDRFRSLGFSRALNPKSGAVEELDDILLDPERQNLTTVTLVIDRIKGGNPPRKRILDAVQQAFQIGNGSCLVVRPLSNHRPFLRIDANAASLNHRHPPFELVRFSEHFQGSAATDASSETVLPPPRPSLFSFNHPLGACESCKGFGRILEVDPKVVIPDQTLSLGEHALQCWSGQSGRGEFRRMMKFAEQMKIPTHIPWRSLTKAQQDLILHNRSRSYHGVYPWFKRIEKKAYKMHVRVFLARYRTQVVCPTCKGTRLKPAALRYQIERKTIVAIWNMSINQLIAWLNSIAARSNSSRHLRDVFTNLVTRLSYLEELGLGYLTLERQARTLSGGETQRVNLATALGSELVSTQFVLDEPSVGLHARDTGRLVESIRRLTDRGNSVLVVEHDLDYMQQADQILEIGPEAGVHGGQITYQGPPTAWQPHRHIPWRERDSDLLPGEPLIKIKNASARNLKGLSIDIPLGRLVTLTGVSGSGKSTLIHEVLERAYERRQKGEPEPKTDQVIGGLEHLSQLLIVDQSPLAKSPRANVGTYTSVWEIIRELFGKLPAAEERGLTKSSFSFNVDGGRCPACSGSGFIREDMQFLSDVFIPCEVCLGKRFVGPVLEVLYEGHSIHDMLVMTAAECTELFSGFSDEHANASRHRTITDTVSVLLELGLGHLTLGHPLSELSGGEAQRLKLVPFVRDAGQSPSLLVFDEPTTGLHPRDVERLIALFRKLTDRGHSVLCVEHNLYLISESDWIIDLGPEGGDEGGYLQAVGTPSHFLAKVPDELSATAKHLRDFVRRYRTERNVGTEKGKKSPARPKTTDRQLSIRGARENNLKNIDLDIPLNQIVALTGLSGSGKSTIAKDIIYSEGQRRYLDCLSPYARQFIRELKKPEIDSITNVQPTICVYQHTFQPGQLSTIGTMSEVYNFLRLLYAKVATQYCPDHPNRAIASLSPAEIAQELRQHWNRSVRILAPIVKSKKGFHKPVFQRALASEILEVRVDGAFAPPSRFQEGLARSKLHSIDFVIGRCKPSSVELSLLEETLQQALSLGAGTVIVHDGEKETVFSTERTCPECHTGFFKPDPEDLSFHSKRGRCTGCDGTGLSGQGSVCQECAGSRLGPIGRNLRIAGRSIAELTALTAPALAQFVNTLSLPPTKMPVVQQIVPELKGRLDLLINFGLDYLLLNRECRSLSGGELQRLRLATAIGTSMTGALYIFDEPSAGLHPLDNAKILSKFRDLQQRGNSVLLIEHDADTIAAADLIIEVGPGAGRAGGTISAIGTPQQILKQTSTLSGQWLAAPYPSPRKARSHEPLEHTLSIKNGSCNSIQDLTLVLPLVAMVGVAGLSGSGKSSLVHGIIATTMSNGTEREQKRWKLGKTTIEASTPIERVLLVDQKPIGINSRSTPASYLGIWDHIRKIFASSIEAKSRGFTHSHFSYNTGKGRCPNCKGLGELALEMSFLAEARIPCDLCGGTRYSEEARSILYRGLSVSQVLAMTFEEARTHFANHDKIHRIFHRACELGLGYLTLGQSSTTLSGGESQRIKLVAELAQRPQAGTLYLLDEPSTGLHRADVARLIKTLHDLVALGNSVIVIEHDPDLLMSSDYIVEMGPGPGAAGGKVIFKGSPSKLLTARTPWGEFLRAAGVLADNRKQAP